MLYAITSLYDRTPNSKKNMSQKPAKVRRIGQKSGPTLIYEPNENGVLTLRETGPVSNREALWEEAMLKAEREKQFTRL